MTAPTVAAIKSNMVASTGVESSRVVGVPAAGHIGSLHVAAVSGRDDAGSVALTHHRAAAPDSVVNLHAIAIDGSNRSIGANARRSSALQRNRPAGRSMAANVATASRGRVGRRPRVRSCAGVSCRARVSGRTCVSRRTRVSRRTGMSSRAGVGRGTGVSCCSGVGRRARVARCASVAGRRGMARRCAM